MSEQFYSQHDEDRLIYFDYFKKQVPANGIFLDVGAGHPILRNNTYFFEQRGWKGVCVEPQTERCRDIRQARHCSVEQCAIKNYEGEVEFYVSTDSLDISTTDIRKVDHRYEVKKKVPCKPLQKVIDKYKIQNIDLMSLDTEGNEMEVWESFDYKKHIVKILIIEYLTGGIDSREKEYLEYFGKLDYFLLRKTRANLILCKK